MKIAGDIKEWIARHPRSAALTAASAVIAAVALVAVSDGKEREKGASSGQTSVVVVADGVEVRLKSEGRRKAELIQKDSDEALAALILINHINCVVTRIKTFNNPAVLEEEYRNISQNGLMLDVIKDEQIIMLICDIMDAITELRIDAVERDMLKEELDQATSDALFDAVSGVSVSGLSPVGIAASALTSVASAGANYVRAKRNLQRTYKRKMLTLDETKMRNLNLLNKSLLKNYWFVINKYGIPDIYRVTEDDVEDLINRMKDEDAGRRMRFLVGNEERFKALPEYWYWRGETSYELGRYGDASLALAEYQKIQANGCKLLRYDATSANVALIRAMIMVDQKNGGPEELREQLKIIDRNTTDEEWQKKYFCALVYAQCLGDIKCAEDVLSPAIDHLEWKRKNSLINLGSSYEDIFQEMDTGKAQGVTPINFTQSGDGLYMCKSLLLDSSVATLVSEEKKRDILSKIVDSENASVREKLFCYCLLDFKHALDKLLPEIEKMTLCPESARNKRELRLPLSWTIARDGEPQVYLTDQESVDLMSLDLAGKNPDNKDLYFAYKEEKQRRSIRDQDGVMTASFFFDRRYFSMHGKNAIVLFQYKRGGGGEGGKCYQIAVLFDIKNQKGQISPLSAAFGEWNGNSWVNPGEVSVCSFKPKEVVDPDLETIHEPEPMQIEENGGEEPY